MPRLPVVEMKSLPERRNISARRILQHPKSVLVSREHHQTRLGNTTLNREFSRILAGICNGGSQT
jgi:hypothetical protein